SYVTEELVRRGHDVTLFASGDSRTSARLVAVTERAIRLEAASRDVLAAGLSRELRRAFRRAGGFHLIPFHVGYPALPFAPLFPGGSPPLPFGEPRPHTHAAPAAWPARSAVSEAVVPRFFRRPARVDQRRTARAGGVVRPRLGRHCVPRHAARRLAIRGDAE